MSKKRWIVLLVAVGVLMMLGAFASTGFRLDRMSASAEETTEMRQETAAEGLTDIRVITSTEAVRVSVSDDEKVHLRYLDSDSVTHQYTCENGVLTLDATTLDRPWYKYIQFNFWPDEREIELQIPASFQGNLLLSVSTGDVTMNSVKTAGNMEITATTGAISLEDASAGTAKLSASTGLISVDGFTSRSVSADCTTGSIRIARLTADDLTAQNATGGVTLTSVSVKAVVAKCTTGSIEFDALDSDSITISATTGDVSGSISRPASAYTIRSSTATGDDNLDDLREAGDGKLDVSTSTGSINITFAE